MAKPKFHRVAVEGATATDGRVIERNWIEEIAAGYNRDTYGARVNMEHISGWSPEPPFNAYGDVLAVRAETVEIELNGKKERRLALFAEIDPTPELVALTKKRQKIYTSIEVAPNFGGTGKAGLVGLAVTDTPASLGTEILAFSASAGPVRDMLNARKQNPDNVFSAAMETELAFAEETAADSPLDKALAAFAKLVDDMKAGPKAQPEQLSQKSEGPDNTALLTAVGELGKTFATAIQQVERGVDDKFERLAADFKTLKADVENTPSRNHSRRPQSTGGDSRELTDC